MLAKIHDDITLEQKHAKVAEEKAQKAFDKYMLDCRADFDAIMAEMTEKVTRRAKIEATSTECVPIVDHWDERSKARKFEIDQLKDAHEILSGSQIAARTAFLTAERSFVAQKTSDSVLRELQDTARTVSSL